MATKRKTKKAVKATGKSNVALSRLQSSMQRLQKDAETLLRRTQKQASSLISKDQRRAVDRLLTQATRLRDDLERRAEGDARWWVPAARLHMLASPDRERAARVALSGQDLPYVFPGELNPLQVEVLAAADRVLPALHVDWARRLAAFAAEALPQDIACVGLWFWPHLRVLDERHLVRALARLRLPRGAAPGAAGLAAAYRHRLGGDVTKVAAFDGWLLTMAMAVDRPVR